MTNAELHGGMINNEDVGAVIHWLCSAPANYYKRLAGSATSHVCPKRLGIDGCHGKRKGIQSVGDFFLCMNIAKKGLYHHNTKSKPNRRKKRSNT